MYECVRMCTCNDKSVRLVSAAIMCVMTPLNALLLKSSTVAVVVVVVLVVDGDTPRHYIIRSTNISLSGYQVFTQYLEAAPKVESRVVYCL